MITARPVQQNKPMTSDKIAQIVTAINALYASQGVTEEAYIERLEELAKGFRILADAK